jgi:antirestriction protein ArdC
MPATKKTRKPARKTSAKPRKDVYQDVTDKILSLLDAGIAPWRKTWSGKSLSMPISLTTGKEYRGINVFILTATAMAEGYETNAWLTYNQASALGGNVKKGEKATQVVFWKIGEKDDIDPKTGKPATYAILRHFCVFNVAQCENLDESKLPEAAKIDIAENDNDPIVVCEEIVDGWSDKPSITFGGGRAYYRPSDDSIHMPPISRFDSSEEFYGTLFHEMIHSTGSANRLNRDTLTDACHFGDTNYSKEELVAEMGAAFLCTIAGIENVTIENSAAYIDGWRRVLKADSKIVVHAAASAQRAVDSILGKSFEN